jgi:hypothetical protein
VLFVQICYKQDNSNIVEIRYQATTGEDTANSEDFVRAVMNYRVCQLVTAL